MTTDSLHCVFITGASRGIGRQMAVAFGATGAHVVVGYQTGAGEARETADLVVEAGGSAEILCIDVGNRDSVATAAADLLGNGRTVDVLVNNAAIARDAPAAMMSDDQWDDVVRVNLTGTYAVIRALMPAMMAVRGGNIVNVSSVAGLRSARGQVNYGATKAAIISMTRTLAVELAGYGIRVNAVVPGFIDDGMTRRLSRSILENQLRAIPLNRCGTGREVAEAVLFLASPAASYITGHALVVDGGLSL